MEDTINNNIDNVEKKSKKRINIISIISASIAFLLFFLAAGGVWIYRLNNKNKSANIELNNSKIKISKLQKEVESLKVQIDTTLYNLDKELMSIEVLKKENDSIKSLFPIHISKIEVANVDENGKNISPFGKEIEAANSMFLMPRITYYVFNTSKPIELKVRLYDADGKCVTGDTSPEGYSYAFKINSVMSGENSLSLSGWGGPDKGHFTPGTYRYEVWYKDMCLKSITFKLK